MIKIEIIKSGEYHALRSNIENADPEFVDGVHLDNRKEKFSKAIQNFTDQEISLEQEGKKTRQFKNKEELSKFVADPKSFNLDLS